MYTMKGFRFYFALFFIDIADVVAQNLENREGYLLSRTKRLLTENNNTCSTQKLLPHSPVGAILKPRQQGDNNSFHSGDKAEFVCKDGYRQIGELQSFICQADNTWREYSEHQIEFQETECKGFCVVKRCNVESFSCKDVKTKIDACKICDCAADCPDSSDEVSCAPTVVDVTGKATGLLSSPTNRQGNISTVFCNSWKLQTNDRGFYIKLLFIHFSLSPNCMQNYVSLENAKFTDPTRTAECCKNVDGGVCRFGGTTSPPLSRTLTNWMTVKFFSETRKSSFIAVWYNVNSVYPNGAIPKQDLTYAPMIELPTRKKKSLLSAATEPILAFILFALLVFAIGSFIACKLGKHFLGPSCSFSHFIACVLRRPIPPQARSPSLSSEQRGLTARTDDISLSGEGSVRVIPGTLQATYLGADSDDDLRHGSTENMI